MRSSMHRAAIRWSHSHCRNRAAEAAMAIEACSREEFTRRLRAVGEAAYHDKHPFHLMMHRGELSRRQVQAWIENRFYYQAMIPRKDAAIMRKAEDRGVRQAWIQRMI